MVGCSSTSKQSEAGQAPVELYVLAAASLADAMKELAPLYESSHPNQKIVISYGSSGTLQKQIEQGAPADLYFSAAKKQMDELLQKDLIDPQHTSNLLKNQLVLVVPKSTDLKIENFEDLQNPSIQKVAIGHPESVPAGTYAKEALTHLGLWNGLQPKLVFAKDVRQVLSYVETGNVEAGIVYQTDAARSEKVKLVVTADQNTHSPIVYPIGVTRNSEQPKEAQSLYQWLSEPEAASVFTKYGFEIVGDR
nr:molybdate ABC transporter substrate-binding protein [Ammoniphilus resinae]